MTKNRGQLFEKMHEIFVAWADLDEIFRDGRILLENDSVIFRAFNSALCARMYSFCEPNDENIAMLPNLKISETLSKRLLKNLKKQNLRNFFWRIVEMRKYSETIAGQHF